MASVEPPFANPRHTTFKTKDTADAVVTVAAVEEIKVWDLDCSRSERIRLYDSLDL